jgi:hypothetical protein
MPGDQVPESAALRRIVATAAAFLVVAAGLAWLLSSLVGRSGALRPGAIPRGSSLPELQAMGERAADPPPDLRETSEKLAKITRENWGRAESYAPRGEEIDPATGEATLPFQGFGVSVDSVPDGARVTIDGRDVGTSPAMVSLDCKAGSEIRIRIEKPAFRPVERTTRCRADRMLRLKIALER